MTTTSTSPMYVLKKKFAQYLPGHKLVMQDDKFYLEGTSIYFGKDEVADTSCFEEMPVEYAGFVGDVSALGKFPTSGLFVNKPVLVYSYKDKTWDTVTLIHGTTLKALFAIGAVLPTTATEDDKKARAKFIDTL